jgi:hypothetical protein
MDDLHEHVQQVFSSFMGYDHLDDQLTIWAYQKRHAEAVRIASRTPMQWLRIKQAAKRWQARNRSKLREADRRWRASVPSDECWCRAKRVQGRKLCAEHLERERLRAAANKAKRAEEQKQRRAA